MSLNACYCIEEKTTQYTVTMWPFFTETGEVGSGKNPKSGFFLLSRCQIVENRLSHTFLKLLTNMVG